MTFRAADYCLPKYAAPRYDGDPNETIRVPCSECGTYTEASREDIVNNASADPDFRPWDIQRDDETGKIVALCAGCRERDYSDGPGERNV